MIDFGAITAKLADVGYEGWFIVEAEPDPAKAPPLEYARIGQRTLSLALERAGYVIEAGANERPDRRASRLVSNARERLGKTATKLDQRPGRSLEWKQKPRATL